ncbi:MAG TPA: SMC-Scp complex subunit ScpB [Candidatus Baltobacteraceae bacterium]|nr:SMC-Scp complex subunit ScpB [Candidatus Baltobacteraceae bacterium]
MEPRQQELIQNEDLERTIEAVLFVAGESLSIERLAKLTRATHMEVAMALARIAETYAQRGIVLREIAGGYRFSSAPSARPAVEAYLLPPRTSLSPAAMESLAIVAYMQPVTRGEIEAVRGVNVDSVVTTLIDRRFITESGRRETPGRPMTYKTTPEFLEAFGLRSLGELPPVNTENSALELPLPFSEALGFIGQPETVVASVPTVSEKNMSASSDEDLPENARQVQREGSVSRRK